MNSLHPKTDTKNAKSRPASSTIIQTKLTIGQSNDKYEQEADRVADRVVNQPVASAGQDIQRKCATCSKEEKPTIQKMEEEEVQAKPITLLQRQPEEELQKKADSGQSNQASTNITNQISASRGGGSPLPSPIQQSMESGIGADFSKVRIHTDSRAQNLSAELNAQAFTVGNDVYFNKGKYNPDTSSGKHLLAHELTHTVQQGASVQRMIQKQDIWTPDETDEDGYTFGREPHFHEPAEGNWAEVQKLAKEKCSESAVESETLMPDCLCANKTPAQVMAEVKGTQMYFMPIAQAHLGYYLGGKGGVYDEDQNLTDLITKDEKIKRLFGFKMGSKIKSGTHSGHFMIEQGHYSIQDYRYAFGGIDRVDWMYDPATEQVTVWFKDPYDFHPFYKDIYTDLGTGDSFATGPRGTNCIHAAAVELLKSGDDDTGAAIFIMRGQAIFPLSHFDLEAKKDYKDGSGPFEHFFSAAEDAL